MRRFPKGSAHELTLDAAFPVVIASASACLRDSSDDAATVLALFHAEAHARGMKDSSSWALLFSAAVLMFAEEVRDYANTHDLDEGDVLRRLALELAAREL
jgi:hypothetical protein